MYDADFADVLANRAHPALTGGAFTYDYLLDEVEAMGDMPADVYWEQSREDRIMRLCAHILRKMMAAVSSYDAVEESKHKHGR